MITRTVRERSAGRRGASAVELALVLGPLFTLILGIFEYSRFLMVQNLAENACREGARFAVVNTSTQTLAGVQAVVTSMMAGQSANIQGLAITVNQVNPATGAVLGPWTSTTFGQAIAVQMTGNYQPVTPALLFMPATIPITTSAVMLSEAN